MLFNPGKLSPLDCKPASNQLSPGGLPCQELSGALNCGNPSNTNSSSTTSGANQALRSAINIKSFAVTLKVPLVLVVVQLINGSLVSNVKLSDVLELKNSNVNA